MKFRPLPSVAYLRERLHYEPATGVLTWRIRPTEHFPDKAHCDTWNTRYAGKSAGAAHNSGYRILDIDDVALMAHRIVWAMFYGNDVPYDIDHIDGNRTNNRIDNLRLATRAENLANAKKRKHTKTGVKGVSFDTNRGKFQAHITVLYKKHHLGRFDTLDEAIAARRIAAERLQGKFVKHE